MLDSILGRLASSNLAAAISFARLPDQIRGYEDLKLERIDRFRDEVTSALRDFGN